MRLIVIIILTILISGCFSYDQKDFDFKDNELKHLSAYKIGDTIYFENQLVDIDTFLVKSIDKKQKKESGTFMARPAENCIWVSIEHLPIDRWHGTTQDINKPVRIDYQKIISISKFPQTKEISYSISFKDFHSSLDSIIGKFHTDTITLNNKKISNYYLVRHAYPDRVIDSENIEIVYWTDNEGLTAYKNKDGKIWTKKSNR